MTRRPSQPEPRKPLYLALAQRVEEMIGEGAFQPGGRLPSVRRFARQMSVSLTTAQVAYRVLEDRGAVEVRPRSGYYVRPRPPLLPEPARAGSCARAVLLTEADLALQVYHDSSELAGGMFGAATPHPSFLPTERLRRILAREMRHRSERVHAGEDIRGPLSLRIQIARRLMHAGCTLGPDDIILTNGTRQALYLSLRAVARPGDTVVVESPTYMGFLQLLQAQGLRVLELDTDSRDGICLEALERVLERERVAACLLVPTFGNPLGHSMPEAARKRLVERLAAAGVPIIEDDVYGDLPHGLERPKALKAYDHTGQVLLCSSFSKTVAPGFRVGWVVPGRHFRAVEQWKYFTTAGLPSPTQLAMAAYLAEGGYDRHLRGLRERYRELMAVVSTAVADSFPAGTRMSRPEGGHVLWVELPRGVDAMSVYERARGEGISLVPGPLFSARDSYSHCIRLNVAVPWSQKARRALTRIAELVGAAGITPRRCAAPVRCTSPSTSRPDHAPSA